MRFQGKVRLLLPDGTQRVDTLPEVEASCAIPAFDRYVEQMHYGCDDITVIGITVEPVIE